ncbi:adenosylcobinamide-GDP ribazoletransferase [Hydrogenophaga intermedia]|uniref:adenosylcobinamide-GDP ribazoletransferase n=1 Tax=Hydrogenophaga intermedia TaxID=65786 RepID=UPI0020443332|nr:adenosylcobinamide-GDP ribazoletransferase [Hydrogenophaga intermedia]MCM3566037.1 adenosylcobinamide-GDP ribazoletransferase [Hydrogenophaga intermedia]
MKHELRLFLVAMQFLTRVPAPRWVGFDPAWLRSCLRHFPLVGACVGLWSAAALHAALWFWPPLVASVLSLAATVWLTGALHEDGLADTVDALGGAAAREQALAIMKDSRIGSYGAVALVLACLLKVATVSALATHTSQGEIGWAAAALVWSHIVSRAAPAWVVSTLSYAGSVEASKARPLAETVGSRGFWIGMGWVALTSTALFASVAGAQRGQAFWAVSSALVACAATTACCVRWLRRRLGGYTGDTLGATQQLVELTSLLAWLAVTGAHRG